ncbi:Mannose/glucose-specific lectin [Bienertia sinuspersici]
MAQEYAKDQIVLKHGPYGSQCAENFCLVLEDNESVKEVIIRHGFIVDAIGFVIAKPCGNTCGEYVTQISGTYGNYKYQCNQTTIATIKIHTNLCPSGYGPYGQGCGVENVKCFSTPCSNNNSPVTGYFGRHNNYLESIGVFVKKESRCH